MSDDDPFGAALDARASQASNSSDPYGDALARRSAGETIDIPEAKSPEVTEGPLGFINGLAETAGKGILNIPYAAAHGAQDVLRLATGSDTNAPDSSAIEALHFPLSENARNVGSSIGETVRPVFDAAGREVGGNLSDQEKATVKQVAPIAGDVAAMLPAANLTRNAAAVLSDLPKPELTATGAQKAIAPLSVSDKILNKSREAGYVVPPSTTNPTIANRALEGFAGKTNVAQAAAIKNQTITNGLARKALGLPQDAPLTTDTLDDLRAEHGKVYGQVEDAGTIKIDPKFHADLDDLTKSSSRITKDFPSYQSGPQREIKNLADSLRSDSMDAGTAVELSKDLRYNANANESMAARTGDPTAKSMARAQRDAAEAVEDQVKRHLEANGKPDLADQWDNARTQIAKSYTVQKALDGAGNVDAAKLGKALKNKNYNDELQTAGDFANAYPKAAKLAGKESMPGFSPLDVYGSVTASLATGSPLPMALGPGRIAARKVALSKIMQPKP